MTTPAVDPVTIEVLRGRLTAVADEMQHALIKSSYSTIVTEALDATCAVYDETGRTVAQACAIPIHLGALTELGRRFARRYPPGEAKPGDVYLVNDPYAGGTHLPDFAVATPVFHAGELVGYVSTMTHHQDIGGVAPGSAAAAVYDHHAEGLRIPMVRLASEGVVSADMMNLLTANSRSPRNMRGDLEAQIAGCRTGEARLRAVFDHWGRDQVRAGVNALLDYAERLTRLAIERMEDGEYSFTDWLDDDGLSPDADPVRIRVTLRVKGSELEFDFTGSGDQVGAAINNVPSSTNSAVYFAVRLLTGDAAPNNDGCYRPVSIILPPGSIVNPTYPAPVNARGVGIARIVDAVLGALSAALPDTIPAAGCGHATVIQTGGFDPATGKRFVGVLGGPLRSGTGARPRMDGLDVTDHDLSNSHHIPLEVTEGEFPVRYRGMELWPDSGGAGRYRGGLGYRAEVAWLRGEGVLALRGERQRFRPWGTQGGEPAPPCKSEVVRENGDAERLPAKILLSIRAGEALRYWSTGGGGYGPPWRRDAQLVVTDVLDGRVSEESARELYGVAVKNGELDRQATETMRAAMQAAGGRGAAQVNSAPGHDTRQHV